MDSKLLSPLLRRPTSSLRYQSEVGYTGHEDHIHAQYSTELRLPSQIISTCKMEAPIAGVGILVPQEYVFSHLIRNAKPADTTSDTHTSLRNMTDSQIESQWKSVYRRSDLAVCYLLSSHRDRQPILPADDAAPATGPGIPA